MIGRALDSNNDIIIGADGSLKLVSDGAEVVQHIRSRLQFFKGEWFLDTNAGVPYFEEIFTKPVNLANIESIFKTKILETPGVSKLTEFTMDYESGANRELVIRFSAETIYGYIDREEVSINV